MVTLHAYVLRELLKTFGLTLVALTALFTMGGGLYNVLRYEAVSAGDLVGFIPMLIPIVITLTMPVAALFAATMVYGRLATDNELLACRAVGINIHRLFLSAMLLSIFVAAFALLFSDLVIPDFVRRLDHFARANLRDLAFQTMQVKGYIVREQDDERYLLTARSVYLPTERALREQDLPTESGFSYLLVKAPVFLHVDEHDTLVRYTAARWGLCQFDTRSTPIEVTLYVDDGRDFDVRGRSVRLKRQQLGPIPIPLKFPRKPAMVDLATLLRWRDRPWEVDRLRPQVRDFLRALLAERFFEHCAQQIAAGQPVTLVDEQGPIYQITAAASQSERKGLVLTEARVTRLDGNPARPLRYAAPRVRLSPKTTVDRRLFLKLDLLRATDRKVIEHNPRAGSYEKGRERPGGLLSDALLVPDAVLAEMQNYTAADVCDPSVALPLGPELAERRGELQEKAARQRRKMGANIHFRLGFSSSALVTVLMAAALGVVFRGGRALAAFGLACIPFGSVAILMVMARQLAENEGTELLGPILTWGGLAFVAVADVLILRLGVRR